MPSPDGTNHQPPIHTRIRAQQGDAKNVSRAGSTTQLRAHRTSRCLQTTERLGEHDFPRELPEQRAVIFVLDAVLLRPAVVAKTVQFARVAVENGVVATEIAIIVVVNPIVFMRSIEQ